MSTVPGPRTAERARPPADTHPADEARRADWARLRDAGLTAPAAFAGREPEHSTLRAVAADDLGLARLLDGHRNAIERLWAHRRADVPAAELALVEADALTLGVWGADPGRGEGPAAALHRGSGAPVLHGVKTFCSGAGLLHRALVLVRPTPDAAPGPPLLVLVDLTRPGTVAIDRGWFAATAMATSLSHRVVFMAAPVLAVLGEPGALGAEPWISGDALRTAATWVGGLEAVVGGLLDELRGRPADDLAAVAATVAVRARDTAVLWLDRARAALDARAADAPATVRLARVEIAARAREALDLAAEHAGSRGMATRAPWARARADLDLLLRQHRLGPVAVRAGRELLGGGG